MCAGISIAGRVRPPGVVTPLDEKGSTGACAKYEPVVCSMFEELRLMDTFFIASPSCDEPVSSCDPSFVGPGSGESLAVGVGAADPGIDSNVEMRNEPDMGL